MRLSKSSLINLRVLFDHGLTDHVPLLSSEAPKVRIFGEEFSRKLSVIVRPLLRSSRGMKEEPPPERNQRRHTKGSASRSGLHVKCAT